ncbi:universal stress protein [Oricola sp.]|uniref:universal stress protein n=1 Tax=Oricola sp. TaxID=1979950 RepID=UPI0025D07AE0|nr:universal stress protein [Oricola sp.]MCI5076468.1 universal stress protein [Oricola sp.]
MSYESILAHLEFDGNSESRLHYAADLAGEIDAYLIGFAATGLRPLHVSEMGVAIDELYRSDAMAQNTHRFEELRQQFMAVAGDGQYSAWRQSQDLPTKALLIHARAADLIISGTPHGASSGDAYRSVDPGELVCNAGRPVLFVGENAAFRPPRLAVVGWKDTPQARRAVMFALPYLRLAKTTLVLAAGDARNRADASGPQDVVRYLLRHGVEAEARIIEHDSSPNAFVAAVRAEHADLVVTGAYGHSRMRERAFGGFTYTLLMQSDLNRLMAG